VAHAAWRCDLLAGRRVSPLASSDNHRVFTPAPGNGGNPAIGWPRTSVRATELAWPALLAAIRAGDVTLHGGESRLWLDGYDAGRLREEDAATRYLRVRGQLDARAASSTLRLVRTTACADPRPVPLVAPAPEDEVLLEVAVPPGGAFDHEVAIAGEPGVYTATLAPALLFGAHYAALSRAIVIE
jgi:hypothetical protein